MVTMDPEIVRKQRVRIGNTLMAFVGGAALSIVITYSYAQGYLLLSFESLLISQLVFWLVNCGFLIFIASGQNLKCKSPAFVVPQMLWAISASLFYLCVLTRLNELIYILLFTVMLYGTLRLSLSSFLLAALYLLVGFGATQVIQINILYIEQFNLERIIVWAVFTYCLFSLIAISAYQTKAKEYLKSKNTELEQALHAKSLFLANMSHEIRTPMNGVLGMLGVLLNEELTSEQRQYTSIAQTSANALLDIVNDILDFSKIEAGKLDLENIPFSLQQQLSEVADEFAYIAHEKGLDLQLDTCSADPERRIIGDPGRLRQILTNLLSNAIKFTSQGEIVLSTTTLESSDTEIHLRFSVQDTGIGIRQESIKRLLEAFTQADASTTRTYGGTGLGLSIAKQLSELMQGEMSITSEEGKGSCFSFTAKFELESSHEHTGEASPRKQLDLNQQRILIYAPSPTGRAILAQQLSQLGASVTLCRTVDKAIAALQKQFTGQVQSKFDLAIVDMRTSASQIPQCAQTIANLALKQGIKPIYTSPINAQPKIETMAKFGFVAYVSSPINRDKLYDTLSKIGEGDNPIDAEIHRHQIRTITPVQQHRRILLVDDNAVNQQVGLITLKKLGFQANAVGNGLEAIEALATAPPSHPYQLVLMDVQMPVLDGFETTRRIRSGDTAVPDTQIPIIAMTGNAMKGDRELCLDAGMDDYISKPIEITKLEAALTHWLHLKPSKPRRTPKLIPELIPEPSFISEPESKPEPESKIATAVSTWSSKHLLETTGDDFTLLDQILTVFLDTLPKDMETLEAHIQSKDAIKASKDAHRLKGAAATIGAQQLAETLADVEFELKRNEMNKIDEILSQIHVQADQLCQTLGQFLTRNHPENESFNVSEIHRSGE